MRFETFGNTPETEKERYSTLRSPPQVRRNLFKVSEYNVTLLHDRIKDINRKCIFYVKITVRVTMKGHQGR